MLLTASLICAGSKVKALLLSGGKDSEERCIASVGIGLHNKYRLVKKHLERSALSVQRDNNSRFDSFIRKRCLTRYVNNLGVRTQRFVRPNHMRVSGMPEEYDLSMGSADIKVFGSHMNVRQVESTVCQCVVPAIWTSLSTWAFEYNVL